MGFIDEIIWLNIVPDHVYNCYGSSTSVDQLIWYQICTSCDCYLPTNHRSENLKIIFGVVLSWDDRPTVYFVKSTSHGNILIEFLGLNLKLNSFNINSKPVDKSSDPQNMWINSYPNFITDGWHSSIIFISICGRKKQENILSAKK